MPRLFDTQSSEIVEIVPSTEGKFSMYVCGPTVYDEPHLGHGRFTLVYDILRRYLKYRGVEVRFVSNITDVDDKIITRAAELGISAGELAKRYEEVWWDLMERLGVEKPDETPHATDWIAQMLELVTEMVSTGVAYETTDGVYLEVAKVDGYGLLARQNLADLRSGARVEVDEQKKSPLDFALWKRTPETEWGWESKFGFGRPGWHTECVAMALGILGEGFDLHGGGMDLAFPHHENERAQAVAMGKNFARHWMHNGFVMVGDEKMAKSLGNFTTLKDLLDSTDPRAYRLLVARSHYRAPLEVTAEILQDAARSLERIDAFARRFADVVLQRPEVAPSKEVIDGFNEAMDEDLNSPVGLAHVFEAITRANFALDRALNEEAVSNAKAALLLLGTLGIVVQDRLEVPQEVIALAEQRKVARSEKDFAAADKYRDEILQLGYVVEDSDLGFRFRKA